MTSIFILLLASFAVLRVSCTDFKPTWESLDKHKLPEWYDNAKFGIFMHWGVYSVPSFGSEWFWWHWKGKPADPIYDYFMKTNYAPGFSYADFAPQFRAEFFDPDRWADLIADSGAKYFVFTSKHHEGFTNWKSNVSWNWNSVDTGPHKDIVGALAESIRSRTDVKFGLYYSLYEWFHPLFIKDQESDYKTSSYIDEVMLPQLYDIVNTYKPEYIWSDGDWSTDYKYWKSREFLAWLYNKSPVKDTVLVNDRWGIGTMCKHGDVKTCADRYHPGKLQPYKWENAMTIDSGSWGFRREASLSDYLTIDHLIHQLVVTVSLGGNLLLNVGPTHDGRILPIFEERLRQIGEWLQVNGDAIYGTKPWRVQNETRTWYTRKGDIIFAIVLSWPKDDHLYLSSPLPSDHTKIRLLGYDKELKWHHGKSKGVVINLKGLSPTALKLNWAWTFVLQNVA